MILAYIKAHPSSSSREIFNGLDAPISYATLKRNLSKRMAEGLIVAEGRLKGTRYFLNPLYELLHTIDIDSYFSKEIDERVISRTFNLQLISGILKSGSVFSEKESSYLQSLQSDYENRVAQLTETEYNKDLERLAIDLSWKSSQIEGNTYSLLETERLLKEKETAEGKPKDDAIMLLNHKDAINFIVANPEYVSPLSVSAIEDIHSILIKGLGVERNIRQRRVGISGTNYVPLDNEYQIKETLEEMCTLVNTKNNPFEKAFLVLCILSYIQPFVDGNKRTARL